MPLPNFFLIGAARSGTTALHGALEQHPQVFMSPVKEPYFFAFDPRRPVHRGAPFGPARRGIVSEPDRYLALFSGASDERVIGEASAIYLSCAGAAVRIARNVPDAKLAAVLRNPVERAYAHYWLMVSAGIEPARSFEAALAQEPERIAAGWFPENFYRTRGLYHEQLLRYFERFDSTQIRVYPYETWRDSPSELLRDLFGFLGVDDGFSAQVQELSVTRAPRSRALRRQALATRFSAVTRLERRCNARAPPPMRAETRRALIDFYAEDVGRLSQQLGIDLSHWLDARTLGAPTVLRRGAE